MTSNANREKAESLLKLAKITDAPVDLNKIANILGFKIVPYPFPSKRKGITVIDRELKVFGVNAKHPEVLQRFSVSHEIGHYINGHDHYENKMIIDESKYFDPHFQQEKEADSFAAELLMPISFLEKDLQEIGLDISKLKEKYKVSEQALWIRLTETRLADKYSDHPAHELPQEA